MLKGFWPDPALKLQPLVNAGTMIPPVPESTLPALPVIIVQGQGGGGGGGARYQHTQSAPLDTWTVNHNLGYFPTSVTVSTAGGVEVDAGVENVTVNQLLIKTSQPFAGLARIS